MKRLFCLALVGVLLLGLLPGCETTPSGNTTPGTQQTEPEGTKETTQNSTENTNTGETNADMLYRMREFLISASKK
jgi:hypothetical protein